MLFSAITFILTFLFLAEPVLAHGFGQRIDLPIPLHLYISGAATTVAVSFFLISFLSEEKYLRLKNYPRFNLLRLAIFKLLVSNPVIIFIKIFFVFVLFLLIVSGIIGTQLSIYNISPVVVWILFAVGMVYISAFLGNIWQVINPWKSTFEFIETLSMKLFKEGVSLNLNYPKTWGVWPAVVFYFTYKWIENVYPKSAEPFSLSLMLLQYSLITFTGMFLFGKDVWLRLGDPFGFLFRILSKFSITEVKSDGKQVNLRPPVVGLAEEERMGISQIFFVLLMLSILSFDGLKETLIGFKFSSFLFDLGFNNMLVNTAGMIFLAMIFILIYLLFSWLIKKIVKSSHSIVNIGASFVYSLLPIAIVYEVAHYWVFLTTEGQRIFYLISDPFGFGWDVFNTASIYPDYGVINFLSLWNFQVVLIVLGHIASVYIAHMIALRIFGNSKLAAKSQYPMLALMIIYTTFSLWILAQPLVSGV